MTDLDLDAIRQRAEAATPGPWGYWGQGWIAPESDPQRDPVGVPQNLIPRHDADAEFIASARTDIPALLAKIEQLQVERDEARAQADHVRMIWDRSGKNDLLEEAIRLRTERDEARATKDLHKDRQEEYLLLAQQAEAERDALALHAEALEEDNRALHETVEELRERNRAQHEVFDQTSFEQQAEIKSLRAAIERGRALADEPRRLWKPYDTHDIGEAFLADAVLDLMDEFRAVLDGEGTDD